MLKLLVKLVFVGVVVYFALDYFYPEKSLKELSEQASTRVEQTLNRVDSLGRSTYSALKYNEMDSLDLVLDQLNPVGLVGDSTRIQWEQAFDKAKLHKQQLNDKVLALDTVAAEHYDQLKNKIELGIRLLEEELEKLQK